MKKKIDVFVDEWIIPTILDSKDKEILLITAEAAGIDIYEGTRGGRDVPSWPYILCSNTIYRSIASGGPGALQNKVFLHISYEEVMEQLTRKIKQESEYKCF